MHATFFINTITVLLNIFQILIAMNILKIKNKYDSQFIGGMPRAIEYLYLSHNKIMTLPSDSSTDLHLPALKLLDVSGNVLNNLLIIGICFILL